MIDIKLIRENRDLVKENIKKKFQDHKLPLVDEVYNLDMEYRKCKSEGDRLRALKNTKSSEIGSLMRDGKRDEANSIKEEIASISKDITELESREVALSFSGFFKAFSSCSLLSLIFFSLSVLSFCLFKYFSN